MDIIITMAASGSRTVQCVAAQGIYCNLDQIWGCLKMVCTPKFWKMYENVMVDHHFANQSRHTLEYAFHLGKPISH